MELLDSPVRHYAWGSHTAIATVQGRPAPTAEPEAELWMGAHPAGSSVLMGSGRPLVEAIEADPDGMLGAAAPHGARLPFLLKLLAADEPLSIQAHPDEATARMGFAAEEAAGVPLDDPKRNYRDPHHKPEMLCAVSDFAALCGFRPEDELADVLAPLGAPVLGLVGGLRDIVTRLLTLPDGERAALVADVVAACGAVPGEPYELVGELARRYPDDVGVVLSLLLNIVHLGAGEAIFLPAGVPHAYLRGVGVEIMASSDNVLRGGLTPKWVDATELLRVLRCEGGPVPLVEPVTEAPGVVAWRPAVAEFALSRIVLDGEVRSVVLPSGAPRVLFCLSGRVADAAGTELSGGWSAFVPAGESVTLSGAGTVFAATTAGPHGGSA